MKYLILILLFASCDYNLLTDREVSNLKYQIEEEREKTELIKSNLSDFKDSLMVVYQNEKKMRLRLQDSLRWADIPSVKCWESGEHVHGCTTFKQYRDGSRQN